MKKHFKLFLILLMVAVILLLLFITVLNNNKSSDNSTFSYLSAKTAFLLSPDNHTYKAYLNDDTFTKVEKKYDLSSLVYIETLNNKKIYKYNNSFSYIDNGFLISSDSLDNIKQFTKTTETTYLKNSFITTNLKRISKSNDFLFFISDFRYLEKILKNKLFKKNNTSLSFSNLLESMVGRFNYDNKSIKLNCVADSKLLNNEAYIQSIIQNRELLNSKYKYIPKSTIVYSRIKSADILLSLVLNEYGLDVDQLNLISQSVLKIDLNKDVLSVFKQGVDSFLLKTDYHRPQALIVVKGCEKSLNKLINTAEKYLSDKLEIKNIELSNQPFLQLSFDKFNNNICIGKAYDDYFIIGEQPAVELAVKAIHNKNYKNTDEFNFLEQYDVSFYLNGDNLSEQYSKTIENIFKFDNNIRQINSGMSFSKEQINANLKVEFEKRGLNEYIRKIITSKGLAASS